MKIDQQYIDSLTEEYTSGEIDRKTAKQKLSEYAKESFNFDLNKQKSFENMIVQLKELIDNYEEPELEDQDGISIKDLITAADQLDGKSVFNDANEEAIDLIESISTPEDHKQSKEKTIGLEKPVVEPMNVETSISEVQESPVEHPTTQEQITIKENYILPEEFSPTITLIGKAPGYYTLPWWIYKWILENEDWKSRPEECPEFSAINILKSLIYFINRDGQVKIRETRNSRFYTLK
ncbi:inhibitor of prohead protease [Proteus phage vB_PmiM_Pm5461]|uniref:Inhibitor of prohead protease n=1 Tax=Proteus phage vB_PmiM_Pm5461 TaxID=1636250 RepID=A0A0G2SSX7_9CAUD|nr:minor head protein inhibitor of protease [Proteus phage vB_PmiM_Pm5461]AKA62050.1 inhibitor of prohead protease [Proteus phage vB_PmiM_Pm5461]